MEDEMFDLLTRVRDALQHGPVFDEVDALLTAEEQRRAKIASESPVWPGVQQVIDAMKRTMDNE